MQTAVCTSFIKIVWLCYMAGVRSNSKHDTTLTFCNFTFADQYSDTYLTEFYSLKTFFNIYD